MRKITKTAIALSIIGAATLGGAEESKAEEPKSDRESHFTAEVFPNNNNVLLDVIASTNAGDRSEFSNVQYFLRDRMRSNYDGTRKNFMLNELSIGDLAGLRLAGQMRFYDLNLVPQAGISFFHAFDSFKIYTALTTSLEEETQGEHLLSLSYSLPGARQEDSFRFQLDNFMWAKKGSFSGSPRLHVGYNLDGLVTLGLAGEVNYAKDKPAEAYGGGFVRYGF
jgi:hypothetical protein